MKKLIFSVMESTRHTGFLTFKMRSGCLATLFSYCAGIKLYQKWSCQFIKNPQWPTGKRSLGLLRQSKFLMALKNFQQVSELYRYESLNLLNYMTLDVKNIHSVVPRHHKDKLFTVLDYPRNFGNVAQGLLRTTHRAAYYLTNPNP